MGIWGWGLGVWDWGTDLRSVTWWGTGSHRVEVGRCFGFAQRIPRLCLSISTVRRARPRSWATAASLILPNRATSCGAQARRFPCRGPGRVLTFAFDILPCSAAPPGRPGGRSPAGQSEFVSQPALALGDSPCSAHACAFWPQKPTPPGA